MHGGQDDGADGEGPAGGLRGQRGARRRQLEAASVVKPEGGGDARVAEQPAIVASTEVVVKPAARHLERRLDTRVEEEVVDGEDEGPAPLQHTAVVGGCEASLWNGSPGLVEPVFLDGRWQSLVGEVEDEEVRPVE